MKINKIILSSYLGILVLFLLFFTVVGFVYKGKEITHEDKYETKTILLGEYKHLHVRDGCKITAYSAQESKLVYSFKLEKNLPTPTFKVRNDTLFILSTSSWINLRTANIESVTCDKASITLQKIEQDNLAIIGNKSTIRIASKSKISALDLTLSNNCNFNAWDFKGRELKLDITKSKAQFSTNNSNALDKAEGKVQESSYVRLPKTSNIQLASDKSSDIKIMY